MLIPLAKAVVVDFGAPGFSQAVSMRMANAVSATVTVDWMKPGAQVDVFLQESNDLENWDDLSTFGIRTNAIGHFGSSESGISMAYVRLRYEVTLAERAVLFVKINTVKI